MKLLSRIPSPIALDRSFADLPAVSEVSTVGSIDSSGAWRSGVAAGADGNSPFGYDRLTVENNPDLIPPRRFGTYNEMRNEDSAVRSALWMFKLTIRGAEWTLLPGGDQPIDRAIRDAVAWQFGMDGEIGQLDLSADQLLQQALLKLDFGSMFEEIIVGDAAVWRDADGDEHLLRPFARFAPRFPATIRMPDGIKTDVRTGKIVSLEQWSPNAQPIPGEKLSYFVLDKEGNDWLGRSLLRTMYGPWKLKRAVMISAGMGWDRYAFGTPVVRYPSGGGATKKREAEAIGRNWRTHERGWVVLEGTVQEGWDVEIKGGNQTLGDPTPLINTYNDEIARAALQHFSSLGRTSSGSRALGEVQVEPFYLASQAIADEVAMQRMRIAFRRFVDLNFGAEFPVPILQVSKIQIKNVATLSTAIMDLAQAGLNFTDRDTQNDVRDILGLRELPPEVVDTINGLPGDVGVEPTAGTPPTALPGDISPQAPGAVLAEGDDLRL